MKLSKLIATAAVLAASATLGAAPTFAQSVEEFYNTHDITLVVSAAPSGGADIYARAFAPIFAKHVPGNPNVIVTNVPGASGLTAASQVQHQMPDDGTAFALLQSNNLYVPLLKSVPFDPREVEWLGSLARERHVLVSWNTSGLKTIDDLLNSKEKVIIGATTLNQINGTLPKLMQDALPDVPIELVTGYQGTGEILLAMQRGEVMARSQSVTSLFAGSDAKYLETGELIPLVQLTKSGDPKLPNVPLITDFISAEQADTVFDFVLLPVAASRPFAVPKGVPADRLAALREAFEAAAADPEFAEAMAKINSETELLTGDEVAEIVEKVYKTPEDVVGKFREFLN